MTKICYKIENLNYFYIIFLMTVGILVFWFYYSVLRRGIIRFLFTLLLFIITILFVVFKFQYVSNLFSVNIVENFNYINMNVNSEAPISFLNFKPIFVLILPIIAFILTFFITIGFTNSVLIFNTALLTTLWYLGYTQEVKKSLFYFVLISLITFCMSGFIKNTRKLSRRGIQVNIKSSQIVIYTIISSFIIAGISSILPQEYKGKYTTELQGKFYNQFINAENGEEKGKKYKYDISFSGYNNSSSKLGGPVTINKLLAFKVKSDNNYYLRGSVKEKYDGYSWNSLERKYSQKTKEQSSMLEDKSSMSFVDKSSSATIYPVELNSSTIFTPILAYNTETEKGNIYYNEIPTFMSSGINDKPYTIYFYTLNSKGQSVQSGNISPSQREMGNAFYADNYKDYLQLPDNISSRVYDLVFSLTKDKKTNSQKVQAIRDYLQKNYPYTLKVSPIPDGQEFLDFFLFTEKKGYCTYFATAETVMCRIAGIPARYVEGFNMGHSMDDNGLFEVRNENAHAWTEVLYLENNNQGLWYTVDAVPNAVDLIHKEEEQDKLNASNPSDSGGPVAPIPAKRPKASGEGIGDSDTASLFTIPPLLLKSFYVFGAILAINLLMVMIYKRRKKLILRNDSVIPLYKYSLERLETIDIINKDTVADLEFIASMKEELSIRVKEVAELAYREYYGSKAPNNFDKSTYFKFIEAYVKKKQNIFEYYIKKYYFIKKISFIKLKVMLLYKKIKTL